MELRREGGGVKGVVGTLAGRIGGCRMGEELN